MLLASGGGKAPQMEIKGKHAKTKRNTQVAHITTTTTTTTIIIIQFNLFMRKT
jgi:hypothetical protein